MEELEKRLIARNTESEESLKTRLEKMKYEASFEDKFDVVLLNDQLEDTFKKTHMIVDVFLAK